MEKKELVIINNEKVFNDNGDFYCDNLDLKVLPEGLNEYFNVKYLVRKSKKKRWPNNQSSKYLLCFKYTYIYLKFA